MVAWIGKDIEDVARVLASLTNVGGEKRREE
jgi:hypothetical protein